MTTTLAQAIRQDGHTREWYAARLKVPYRKMCRLLDGTTLFDYPLARALAVTLRRPLDELFVPTPVKEGTAWVLRFAARPLRGESESPGAPDGAVEVA